MSERSFNKYLSSKQSQAQAQDINTSNSYMTDEFNLNAFYLKEIGFLMEEWRLLNLYGIQGSTSTIEYYDRCIKILDGILDLLSAKINPREEAMYSKWIRILEQMAKDIFLTKEDGSMMIDRNRQQRVNYCYRYVYRYFQRQLETKGMLTKTRSDPKLAMSDMN